MNFQKQPSTGVIKRRSENMQQIYRRTAMPKCDFSKVAFNLIEITLRHGYSSVNLLHIFRTPFPKNACRGLLLELPEIEFFKAAISSSSNTAMQFLYVNNSLVIASWILSQMRQDSQTQEEWVHWKCRLFASKVFRWKNYCDGLIPVSLKHESVKE